MKVLYRLILLSLLLVAGQTTYAQRIITAEYFWDSDPGVGNGTPLQAADGSFDEIVEQIIGTGIGLPGSTGVHTFNIRVRDSFFKWSKKFTVVVNIDAPLNLGSTKVTMAEYFWDTDPGVGNGLLMLAFDGSFDSALETVFQNAHVPGVNGLHLLGIRTMDANNTWGPAFKVVVEVEPALPNTGNIKITAAEYFWDTDPGLGNGAIMLAFDGNFNEAMETVMATANVSLSPGNHKLNLRVRDGQNNWGPVFGVVINIQPTVPNTLPSIKVTAGEYFWGPDPGQGNGFPLLAFDGNFSDAIEKLTQSISAPGTSGVQKLSFRARDGANNWGKAFSVNIVVDPANGTMRPIKIVAGEYFFNSDPGLGNATPIVAADGNFDESIEKIIGGGLPGPVAVGLNTLYIRTKDANNRWGKAFGVVVNMDTSVAGISANINGTDTVCANQSLLAISYSTLNLAGLTYTWTATGGSIISGAGTASVLVNWTGTAPYRLHVLVCDPITSECKSDSIDFIVKPLLTGSRNQSICFGTSAIIGGLIRNTTGTYSDTLLGSNGCDSIVAVNLTVLPQITQTINPVICFGDTFGGYHASGTYYDTLTAANGCDSILTTNLMVRQPIATSVNITICQGYDFEGYTVTGLYSDTFTSYTGCDSIRTVNLTVTNVLYGTEIKAVCFGQSYLGYNVSGVFLDTFSIGSGCDSVRTLSLTVLPQTNTMVTQTICQGQTYAGYSMPSVYMDTLTSFDGCDSIRTLLLTVLPAPINSLSTTICPGDSFEGYSTSGTYTDTFTSVNGCDSTRILVLTVRPQNVTSINVSICPGSLYEGYHIEGTYVDVFWGSNGCDSTRILNLTVNNAITMNDSVSICPGDSIWLGGAFRSVSGLYPDTLTTLSGCDSIVVTALSIYPHPDAPFISRDGNILSVPDTFDGYIWYQNEYVVAGANENGVAFIANGNYHVLVTGANGCSVSSDTLAVTNVGIDDVNSNFNWQAYPNPTDGRLFIQVSGLEEFSMELYNSLGQKLLDIDRHTPQPYSVDMSVYSVGVYYVKLKTGTSVDMKKVLLSR